jgi:DNA-binding NarL/FixJ family response regulator
MTPPTIALPEAWRRKHLTPAEQRVVELIGSGLPTKIAAAQLNRSPCTVRNQLNHAMRKLDVHSRYELIARVQRPAVPAPVPETDEAFAYAI